MICCVKTGDKYGHDYVRHLKDGLARHMPAGAVEKFICYTDDPVPGIKCRPLPVDLPGWWAKLGLFSLGEPLVYFDLDMVICGSLQPLLKWQGFGIIKNEQIPGYNSSVMKLTGNEGHIWKSFKPDIMDRVHGDQDWLNIAAPHAPTFPRSWFPSWRVNTLCALDEPPPKAIAINCHGSPKPHEISGWMRNHWTGAMPAEKDLIT
jgi:hypothetical protein